MERPDGTTTTDQTSTGNVGEGLPTGDHPLEVAARKGIGPLSPQGRDIWHGNAEPCVTCGQLVPRFATACDHCGQDLSEEMLEKMRAHAGPWYVLEHVRPFPGVSLDRIVRQIRRGLLTEMSIVRGPATEYQWRFAVETPGLCRYFGRCWNCHESIRPADTYCPKCLSYLTLERPQPAATHHTPAAPATAHKPPVGTAAASSGVAQPSAPARNQLAELSAAIDQSRSSMHNDWEPAPRVGGVSVTWIAAIILIVVVLGLTWITELRSQRIKPTRPVTPDVTRTVPDQPPPVSTDTGPE